MMKQSKIFSTPLLLLITALALPLTIQAEVLSSQSSNIFKFQQKLAMNGNEHAQYRLASMYEMGDGVVADIEQAKHWYGRAAEAGSIPASQRSTYLTVKQKGYDPAKNAGWLNSVKTDAGDHKGQAMFLLGQLYREGIGVDKDLDKSLELFKQVRILGVANVDNQITLVQGEIAAKNKAEQQATRAEQINQAQENARLKQSSAEQLAMQQAKKEETLKLQVEAEKAEQAEKIRRYERAMMQIKLEQQKIDEQQAWASGGSEATVDDEI